MNKAKIAKKLEVTHSSVSQWFLGLTRPTLENMIKLRDEFDIPIDAWLNIKQWLLDRKSMPDTAVHVQVEPENQLHQKEIA